MYQSIVVGTDGSDSAKRAVEDAAALAKALGARMHVVSAYEPVRGAKIAGAPEGAAKVWAPLPDSEVEGIVSEAAASVRLGGVEVDTHAVRGDPVDALLDVAKEVSADLIVVGSKGMHSAKRFVLGNVPNKVSHRAQCAVLIVSTE